MHIDRIFSGPLPVRGLYFDLFNIRQQLAQRNDRQLLFCDIRGSTFSHFTQRSLAAKRACYRNDLDRGRRRRS